MPTVRALLPQLTCSSTNSNFGLVSTRYDTVLHRRRNSSLSPTMSHLATVYISIAKCIGGGRDSEEKTTKHVVYKHSCTGMYAMISCHWIHSLRLTYICTSGPGLRSRSTVVAVFKFDLSDSCRIARTSTSTPHLDTPTRRSSKLVRQ